MGTHPEHPRWIKCSCGFTKVEKPMITIENYLMGRDKKYPSDYNDEMKSNATTLVEKVNSCLQLMGIKEATVSSGWRPKTYNDTIPNASKTSKHITCEAVDLQDSDKKLKEKILANLAILEQLGLYLEHPDDTPTWAHLQMKAPPSGNRVFRAKAIKA